MAEIADAMGEPALAGEARAAAERTRVAVEKTYWLPERGFYGFATTVPRRSRPGPSPGRTGEEAGSPRRARECPFRGRGHRAARGSPLVGAARGRQGPVQLDHIGGGALATDWGARILSNTSRLYDPLSYHYGSVWPLFTGWASVGAYRYGRPHVGYQALMANALLRSRSAMGYVTELLSGDFNAPFGRSSDHQVWSEAMV